jgi:hypothetical protein
MFQLDHHQFQNCFFFFFKSQYTPSIACVVQIDQLCWSISHDQLVKDKLTINIVSLLEKMISEFVQNNLDEELKQKFKNLKTKIEKDRKSHKRSDGLNFFCIKRFQGDLKVLLKRNR